MDFGIQLGQSQRLEQTLSPQLLQSIAILQKNALELETAIKEEVETNPLLELEERESDEIITETNIIENSDNESNLESANSELDFEKGIIEDGADADYDKLDGTSNEDWDKKSELLNNMSDDEWDRPIKDREISLQDRLVEQLREWNGTKELLEQLKNAGCGESKFREYVLYLINSLDENGFLQGADEIAMTKVLMDGNPFIIEMERFMRGEISLEETTLPIAEAIHVLQNFKPRGIGARNLQESFLIQALSIENFPELAIKILKNSFEDLMALRYPKIAKDLSVSTEKIQQAVLSLSQLTPHPGLQISNTPSQIKVADMRVVEKKGRIEVECFKRQMQKKLRINETYASMLADKSLGKIDREYIQNNLNKAKEFIKAIDNRFSTMEQVMRAIVLHQKDFFRKGPAFLKPMVLQDIADEIGRDLSTVSRVTNGKYVDTPYGIFELKQFFTSGVRQGDSSSSEVIGSAQIIAAIKKLIEEENKKKPLSDQAISNALELQGIKVARRTVTKYREEELKILSTRLRKQI